MGSNQERLAHLPDGSQELAAAADLTVTLDGCPLPLHSAVLAAGSRVLRSALFGAAGDGAGGGGGGAALDPTAAAAVQQAFESHSLKDVQAFLRLLYNPVAVVGVPAEVVSFKGVIRLADKLDAAALLQVRGARLLS